jgi:hypothetical protein
MLMREHPGAFNHPTKDPHGMGSEKGNVKIRRKLQRPQAPSPVPLLVVLAVVCKSGVVHRRVRLYARRAFMRPGRAG